MPKKEHLIEVIVIPPPVKTRMIKANGEITKESEARPADIIREVFAGSATDFLKERYPMVYDKSGWRGYIVSDTPLSELEAVKPKQKAVASGKR